MSHRIWSFAALVASMLSQLASTVSAGLVFSDDFENYSDQAAFAASWSAVGNPPHVLDTGFGYNSNQSLRLGPQGSGNGTSNRWYRNLSVPMVPTDVTPVLFRFDFYLDPSGESTNWLSDWQLADVRGYGGGTFGSGSIDAVVAIGVDPPGGQNLDSYSAHFFQGRVLNTVQRGATYYSLDALPTAVPRSSGWHTLAAQIGDTHIDFFVDGLPAESVNQGITTAFDTIVLGSDLPSQAYWLDNIELLQVPEPSPEASFSVMLICAIGFLRSVVSRNRSYVGVVFRKSPARRQIGA